MANLPVLIAPSILAANFGALEAEIKNVAQSGADWIHIDVMDGSFVPPITFGHDAVAVAKRACNLLLDAHLMVEHPETQIEAFKNAGVDRLTIHQEVSPHLHRSLGAIKAAGLGAGVALNPGTPVETVFDVLELCDLVLIMTVNPGWGGQKFLPRSLKKIAALRVEIERQKLAVHIQVDGGITSETIKLTRDAGANIFVAGTSVFGQKDRAAAIKALKDSAS